MAGGPGTPELVVAAARAGGMGFLAGGYLRAEALAAQIAEVRRADVVFGVNLFAPSPMPIVPEELRRYAREIAPDAETLGVDLDERPREDDDDWQRKLQTLIDDPVPVVSFTFGIPSPAEIAALRSTGTLLVQSVTSPGEAQAAAEAGFGALAVQSSAAGGHWGTLTPTDPPQALPLDELLGSIAAKVGLPLFAAGGIATPADVVTALDAGASAVMVGTALLLADEAATAPTHRAALTDPSRTETVQTRAFTGRPARGIRNGFIDRHDVQAPLGYPAVHHLTSSLRRAAAAAGDAERLHLWAGTGFRASRPGLAAAILNALAGSL
jgi:NAD(P)H-dependent flavin oxidoreductase YrpB (nitropropane dioxygenase family)